MKKIIRCLLIIYIVANLSCTVDSIGETEALYTPEDATENIDGTEGEDGEVKEEDETE